MFRYVPDSLTRRASQNVLNHEKTDPGWFYLLRLLWALVLLQICQWIRLDGYDYTISRRSEIFTVALNVHFYVHG